MIAQYINIWQKAVPRASSVYYTYVQKWTNKECNDFKSARRTPNPIDLEQDLDHATIFI